MHLLADGVDFSEAAQAALTLFLETSEEAPPPRLVLWYDRSEGQNSIQATVDAHSWPRDTDALAFGRVLLAADPSNDAEADATPPPLYCATLPRGASTRPSWLWSEEESAPLPHVVLAVHERLAHLAKDTSVDTASGNVDWERLGLQEALQDDDFLNQLQTGVAQWITQIRAITTRTWEFPANKAAEELALWTRQADELQNIAAQLQRPGVLLTLALLRETKRFVALRALENNTGLDAALATTRDVQAFLAPYPLAALTAARDFGTLVPAVQEILAHFPKLRQSRHYALDRAAQLLSATTQVIHEALAALLEEHYATALLFLDYKEYEQQIRFPVLDVFAQLADGLAEWKDFMLDQARRRKITGMNRVLEQLTWYHEPLKERLDQIHEFRHSHERLREVVHKVLRQDEPEAIQQVEQAPRLIFSTVKVLDLSPVGTQAFTVALEEYDLQMDALEERLARLLRDKLQACHDAEDMFRVFARFHLLLERPRVRAAVKEFQMQLIQTVAVAVEKLQSKFTLKYESSAAARISRLRGIPPVAGKILWAQQMERQVHTLMERMGHVLGPNWGQLLEGRQLRKSGDELLAKLDARSFFRHWVMEWEKELTQAATSKISSYPIVMEPVGRGGALVARVNFDEKSELLFKEIRHLKWLGYGKDIPRTLNMVSEEALARYPFAVAIKTALRSYQAVRVLVTPELEPLVMPQLLEIRECIAEAYDVKLSTSTAVTKKRRVRWDTPEMTDFVAKLTDAVTKFEDRIEQLLRACDKVDIALNLLEEIEYDSSKFQSILGSIQKTIDEMSLSGYSELDTWVNVVADKMSEVLAKRLEGALKAWNKTFKVVKESESGMDETERSEVDGIEDDVPNMTISISVVMEIVLRNQQISAIPAIPTLRSTFMEALHAHMGVVCQLPKPKSGRFEVFDTLTAKSSKHGEVSHATFDHVVKLVPPHIVADAYASIEDHINDASIFLNQWLSYQVLWDMQVADVVVAVGADVDLWRSLLLEASEARSTLDSSATVSLFGPVSVHYGKVQSQINLKYDAWQKELQTSFSSILGQCIHDMHGKVSKAKTTLEETTLDSASTESIVLGVTFIQEMKQNSSRWLKDIESLQDSEKILKRQRFIFHGDWMETSVVKGLYESLLQILDRRSRTMDQQIPLLQARVTAEDKSATKQLTELVAKWREEKPLRGNLSPPDALALLSKYELALKKGFVHQENLVRARDALGLENAVVNSEVSEALSELADLNEVWEAMTAPFKTLDEIKDSLWSTSVMRKIRRSLDDLLASMRSLPNRIRQYDAYIQMHESVKGYLAGHGFLSELKTDALKERHWKTVLQRLGIRIPFTDLTVGNLWDHGVLIRKKEVGEILAVAQGEMALEVFLGDIRDRWTKQELELVLFQNRTRLIKGWDDLFATLDDHISGLVLMKSSPYYRAVREFQEEGKLWEERLTSLRAAFDLWVDVQRRWVYLEGILFGSSDIKAQLPTEWSRFKSVDTEFIALMRRIASKPYAMEVLNIDNLHRTLERLGNLMGVIQRALGEYLAKQRSDFSRFYFLGDDDLLEIMGNAGEPGKVLGHVGKMFSGMAGAKLSTSNLPEGIRARLDAMVSKDGEIVHFNEPIDIREQGNVKDWLKSLEDRMQTTLASLLEKAVAEDFFTADVTFNDEVTADFVNWTKKYPAQVCFVTLAVHVIIQTCCLIF